MSLATTRSLALPPSFPCVYAYLRRRFPICTRTYELQLRPYTIILWRPRSKGFPNDLIHIWSHTRRYTEYWTKWILPSKFLQGPEIYPGHIIHLAAGFLPLCLAACRAHAYVRDYAFVRTSIAQGRRHFPSFRPTDIYPPRERVLPCLYLLYARSLASSSVCIATAATRRRRRDQWSVFWG